MGRPLSTSSEPFIPDGSLKDLELVRDELFLDMEDPDGIRFFVETLYDQAVEDCMCIGESSFVLRVCPDMRGLLLSQLAKHADVSPVYRSRAMPKTRLIPTGEVEIRFMGASRRRERLLSLSGFVAIPKEAEFLTDGIYPLAGKYARDPITSAKTMELSWVIRRAAPVMVPVPSPAENTDP